MKPLITSVLTLSLIVSATLFSPQKAFAVIRDGGIDPANLGKGEWIYSMKDATNRLGGHINSVTNEVSLFKYYKNIGVRYVMIKMGTGSTNYSGCYASPHQVTVNLCNIARTNGVWVFGYTRSYGSDLAGESALVDSVFNNGADGFIFDAEAEWESSRAWIGTNGPALAWELGQMVRSNWPTKFIAHAPFPVIYFHSSFPYKEFGYWCDAVMPQVYHLSTAGLMDSPSATMNWMDVNFRTWQNSLAGTSSVIDGQTIFWTNSIKPIVPVQDVYGEPGNAVGRCNGTTIAYPDEDVTEFIDFAAADPTPATAGGYKGVNFWRADLHGTNQFANIAAGTSGNFSNIVSNIVMDDAAATRVGTWTSVRVFSSTTTTPAYHGATGSDTNSFGTNYCVKAKGTGSAYMQFTPNIVVGGEYNVYQWHVLRADAATNVPFVINYNGGSTTVFANQQTNDGKWTLLGKFNFAAGTSGNIRVTDGFSNAAHFAVVDGLKLVMAPPSAIPAAPSGLSATAVSSSQINLAWTDNSSNETGFVVSRATTSGGPYTDIAVASANATSFSDSGLAPSTTYYYVVGATNALGVSADSNEANATTQFGVSDIIIDNPAATVVGSWSTGTSSADKFGTDYRFKSQGTGAAYLQYTPNITTAGDYEVYEWHPIGANRTVGAPHVITYNGAAATEFVNQQGAGGQWNLLGTYNFLSGTSGNVKITDAFADAGQVVMADAIKFVFVSSGPSIPIAPSGLSATAVSSSQINLSWTDNSSDESNFIVARSTTSGGPYSDIQTLAANTTSFSNSGLSADTTYYYVLRATNAAGASANSAQASATTFPPAPSAPSGLSATTISAGEIDLLWSDNSANESAFVVGRSTTSGGPYSDIISLAANTTTYDNTGLSANTTYYYVVRATNSGGSSANSAQASATTLPFPPSAPGGLSATAVSSSQINLSWTDNSPNETSFTVARSTTSGGPYSDIVTLAENTTSYNNTNLAANTTYYYVVRASNTGGSSPNSNQASNTTFPLAPNAPSGLSVTAIHSTRVDLTWIDNSANESNFILARSTTSGTGYTDIATLPANTTSYSNTNLSTNTTYFYVVRASNASGSSANSAEASATTPESDLLIDNKSATVVGAWTLATASADKYGTDYRFAGQGTGANSLQYRPYITTAGNYDVFEFHPQGSNRTTNAPHVIAYNGGTQTVFVNQKTNGGVWNYIGTFNFAAGNAGNIKITDGFSDVGQVVMADAIKLVPTPTTIVSFTSVAAQDGYIIESTETSGVGGTATSNGSNTSGLRVGDDVADKQYKSIVSFDTSTLPDGAVIVSATLKIKRGAVTGTSPFTTHGNCNVDIKGGTGFGGAVALAAGDFQAAADAATVATMSNPLANGDLSTGTVSSTGRGFVNKTGTTQFRVYFATDDNDDLGNDYMGFYPGDNGTASNRPVLEIEYQ